MTIKEATRKFVAEMDAIPTNIISKLMMYEPEDWREVTEPTQGDRVHVSSVLDSTAEVFEEEGEIYEYDEASDVYYIRLDDGVCVTAERDGFEVMYDNPIPMWYTMWSFRDCIDSEWLKYHGGLKAMSKLGFRIFESDEYGYFFGIDGAGFDFYSAFWIPLYKARGLHWHDEETEND